MQLRGSDSVTVTHNVHITLHHLVHTHSNAIQCVCTLHQMMQCFVRILYHGDTDVHFFLGQLEIFISSHSEFILLALTSAVVD